MGGVFISSTCYDLLDARAELEQHLKELNLDPVLSDRPSSGFVVGGGPGDSIETCLVNLRRCEAAIFLFSQRYGHPLPGMYNQLSATHVEYNEAIKAGIPVFVYARDRLLAEYGIWRKDPNMPTNNLAWTQHKGAADLFKLLEARETSIRQHTGSAAPNNWISTFSSSIDLKEMVAKDLAARAEVATLRKLIATGEAPAIAVVTTANNGQTPNFNITLSFVNASKVAALNVEWADNNRVIRKQGVIMVRRRPSLIPRHASR